MIPKDPRDSVFNNFQRVFSLGFKLFNIKGLLIWSSFSLLGLLLTELDLQQCWKCIKPQKL